jgi:hypothetical protein
MGSFYTDSEQFYWTNKYEHSYVGGGYVKSTTRPQMSGPITYKTDTCGRAV